MDSHSPVLAYKQLLEHAGGRALGDSEDPDGSGVEFPLLLVFFGLLELLLLLLLVFKVLACLDIDDSLVELFEWVVKLLLLLPSLHFGDGVGLLLRFSVVGDEDAVFDVLHLVSILDILHAKLLQAGPSPLDSRLVGQG